MVNVNFSLHCEIHKLKLVSINYLLIKFTTKKESEGGGLKWDYLPYHSPMGDTIDDIGQAVGTFYCHLSILSFN